MTLVTKPGNEELKGNVIELCGLYEGESDITEAGRMLGVHKNARHFLLGDIDKLLTENIAGIDAAEVNAFAGEVSGGPENPVVDTVRIQYVGGKRYEEVMHTHLDQDYFFHMQQNDK